MHEKYLSVGFGVLEFENCKIFWVVGKNCDTPVHGDLALASEDISDESLVLTSYSFWPLCKCSLDKSSILPIKSVAEIP